MQETAYEILFKLIQISESMHDGDLKIIGLQPKMCPAHIWTEGYGHAILDEQGKQIKGIENKYRAYEHSLVYTEIEAVELLKSDIQIRVEQVAELQLDLDSFQFAALVDFVFNLGIKALKTSTMLKLIKADPSNFQIIFEFLKWVKSGEQTLQGLVIRRQREASLYFTGTFKPA